MQTFPIPVTLDLTALQEHNLVAGWEHKFHTGCPTSYCIVYGLKLWFSWLIRKYKKNVSFKKLCTANLKICMQKILGLLEFYVVILVLTLLDNSVWYGTLCMNILNSLTHLSYPKTTLKTICNFLKSTI